MRDVNTNTTAKRVDGPHDKRTILLLRGLDGRTDALIFANCLNADGFDMFGDSARDKRQLCEGTFFWWTDEEGDAHTSEEMERRPRAAKEVRIGTKQTRPFFHCVRARREEPD